MRNIYKNKLINQSWLESGGNHLNNNYYLNTTVHNF